MKDNSTYYTEPTLSDSLESGTTLPVSDSSESGTAPPVPTAAKNAQVLSQISQEVATLREERETVQQLRGQVRWLRGGLIAAIFVLGGGFVGMALSLRQEQVALSAAQGELAEQVEAMEGEDSSAEQFGRLEEQLRSLNEQAQTISDQARQLSEQFPDVSLSQWESLQQRLESLEEDIQNDLSGEALSSRFGQLSDRLQQLLGQPETAPADEVPTEEDAAAPN